MFRLVKDHILPYSGCGQGKRNSCCPPRPPLAGFLPLGWPWVSPAGPAAPDHGTVRVFMLDQLRKKIIQGVDFFRERLI
jgi:hypothetical protein